MKIYLTRLLLRAVPQALKLPINGILFLLLSMCLFISNHARACGEAGTYFNFYVPPNNEIELRDVAIVVTALYDNTKFRITDTGEDGDTDDSASGTLMAGQSYILYLRNGINDDAPHAGEPASKQDGDHFLVTSNQLILVSQSTASDWQHNWLAADNKTSMGTKFFIFSTKVSVSPNDINVMAYQDSTYITVTKISTTPTLSQGFTSISYKHDSIVLKRMLSPGQDLIYYYPDGRDLLQSGETYLVQTNKPVTVQYGALYTDEHDGGGYVPSSGGGSQGNLFYLTVPFQDTVQQEIRIVSENAGNNVTLDRYDNGQWVMVDTFNNLGQNTAVEWVGKARHETYATVFRITCSKNKNVKVFEGNWIETGSMNTSDIAAMATSTLGTTSGQDFLEYMPIPAAEGNITDPFTGNKMARMGTHAYISGNPQRVAHVTVTDAYTNGKVINRKYTIPVNYYADCALDSLQWLSIYNGTGTEAGGPQRPYLHIQSDQPVSVMISNHNNDWTMYMGSSVTQNIKPVPVCFQPKAKCGDTVRTSCRLGLTGPTVDSAIVKQVCDNGMTLLSATMIDSTTDSTWNGIITIDSLTGITNVTFPIISLMDSSHVYVVQNNIIPTGLYYNGQEVALNTVLSVSTSLTGVVDSMLEMANATTGIVMQTGDTTCLHISGSYTASANQIIEKQNVDLTAACNTCLYNWNLDSVQTATERNITYNFPSPGTYTLSLLVSDSTNSCSASSAQTFKVSAQNTTGINTTDKTEVNIWSAGNKVYVNPGDAATGDATISIYNELGQLISREVTAAPQVYTREFGAYAAQYLLVNVMSNGNMVNKQVFISAHR